MPKFSKRSKQRLSTCHEDIQLLMSIVIQIVDCTILEGHREKDSQNLLYSQGKSRVFWPNSTHNSKPSMAVDVAPYPIPKDWRRPNFDHFAGVVRTIGLLLGLKIRWGGSWNGDWNLMNQQFNDLVHFEVTRLPPELQPPFKIVSLDPNILDVMIDANIEFYKRINNI